VAPAADTVRGRGQHYLLPLPPVWSPVEDVMVT
jgi:hypothetical protein